jgi:hypothetical protein
VIEDYVKCTDFSLYEHMATVANPWAMKISARRPFKMLFELHATEETPRTSKMEQELQNAGIETILASSHARLSKYHATQALEAYPIFVVDHLDPMEKPVPIEKCTRIFQKYEETRMIERLYVAAEDYARSRRLIIDRKL